jgi:hypothetical protein
MNESLRADVEATTAGVNEATTQVFFPVTSEKVPCDSFFFLEPTPSTRMEQAAVVLEFFFPAISNPPGSNQDRAVGCPIGTTRKTTRRRTHHLWIRIFICKLFFIHG